MDIEFIKEYVERRLMIVEMHKEFENESSLNRKESKVKMNGETYRNPL